MCSAFSVLTRLCPQTLSNFGVHCLGGSQINVSQQNTKCCGQWQADWRITCSPSIFFPHLRPANIPSYAPAPPKILCASYFLNSFFPPLLSLFLWLYHQLRKFDTWQNNLVIWVPVYMLLTSPRLLLWSLRWCRHVFDSSASNQCRFCTGWVNATRWTRLNLPHLAVCATSNKIHSPRYQRHTVIFTFAWRLPFIIFVFTDSANMIYIEDSSSHYSSTEHKHPVQQIWC